MGIITSAMRSDMAGSTFGLPGKRAYPMPDAAHAADAKARAKQELDAGRLTRAEYDQIIAKANGILGEK